VQAPAPIEEPPGLQHPGSEDAYWFFLSYFLEAQDMNKDKFIASWSYVLGKSYKAVVNEFLDKGLIMQAGLKEKLGGMLRIYDLQELLKEQGLSVSGKKDTLLSRYIEARPQEAASRASKMAGDYLVCTPEGRKEVKQHTNLRAYDEDSAKHEMKHLVTCGKIDQAAEVVNTYMKSVDRTSRANYSEWTQKAIKTVMNIKKARGLTEAETNEARINAIIELIWYGDLKSAEYSPNPIYQKFSKSALVAIGRRQSRDELRELSKEEFISGVEILCQDDSCPVCKAAAKVYPLGKAPLIPIKGCRHKDGCRCCYTPVV
jgi:hypothetical protein